MVADLVATMGVVGGFAIMGLWVLGDQSTTINRFSSGGQKSPYRIR